MPSSLTEVYRSTAYMLCPTPTSAARWMTDSNPTHCPLDGRRIANVANDQFDVRVQLSRTPLRWVHLLQKAIQDANMITLVEQAARDVAADEAGPPR